MIDAIVNTLITIVKEQAEIFLLDAGEFYPFGTVADKYNKIIPIAAYLGEPNDRPQSVPLIELIEEAIKAKIISGDYIIGAVAIDVTINENDELIDGLEIRVFEHDRSYKQLFRYAIKQNTVVFELI
jgi:hypothetical protein